MEALRPNHHRAKVGIIMAYIGIGADAISGFSEYLEYNLLRTAANGGMVSTEEAESNDLRQMLIGFLSLAVVITSLVYFIRWFRRAYFNLHLRADYLTFSEGWAAGSWFVPILCWFRPYQIMKELYTETDNYLSNKIPSYVPTTNIMILNTWWALWIINNFLGNFVMRMTFKNDTIDGMMDASIGSMIMSFIGLPLGLLVVKIIKDYSEMETLLIELKDENSELTKPEELNISPAV
jgi:hypothetical protein